MDNVNATVSMIPNSNVIHGSGQNWNINNSTRGNESQLDRPMICLLYTSDAADERSSVDLGGRRIIKKKNRQNLHRCQVDTNK
mgnify:CR=1 FL=1